MSKLPESTWALIVSGVIEIVKTIFGKRKTKRRKKPKENEQQPTDPESLDNTINNN